MKVKSLSEKSRSSHHAPFVVIGSVLLLLVGTIIFQTHFCPLASAACFSDKNTLSDGSKEITELAKNYWIYSSAALQRAKNQGKVVLYFWAPWCASCTSLDLDLTNKKVTVPDGVTILRVDYDHASELKRQYSVVIQHTFVQIDHDDKPLNTWVGGEIKDVEANLR
jgi:thiol:disulfide interchange protein